MAKRKYRAPVSAARRGGKNARAGRPGGRSGALWLYGLHPVAAALGNPSRRPQRLLATEQGLERLIAGIGEDALDLRPESVGRADLDHLLPDSVHQGLALQAEPLPALSLEDFLAGETGDSGEDPATARLLVALDQVTDPQNVGAILRSAAFFGARAVLLTERHAPPESGALAKAAAGALDMVPLIRVGNLSAALRQTQNSGYWCVGLDGDAPDSISIVPFNGPTVLVLGAEGSGLRRLTVETCDQTVALHRPGGAHAGMDSLNVSNASAVAMAMLVSRAGGTD